MQGRLLVDLATFALGGLTAWGLTSFIPTHDLIAILALPAVALAYTLGRTHARCHPVPRSQADP
jgi:hypothetical protein